MPYIKPERREAIHNGSSPADSGELNYMLTELALSYYGKRTRCYQTFNDILGAFESAKLEFYSRLVRPYEEQKMREHGDVF